MFCTGSKKDGKIASPKLTWFNSLWTAISSVLPALLAQELVIINTCSTQETGADALEFFYKNDKSFVIPAVELIQMTVWTFVAINYCNSAAKCHDNVYNVVEPLPVLVNSRSKN